MHDPGLSGHYPHLLSPWQVGPLQLRNRVLCSPMTTGFGFDDGVPNEQLLDYFRARSRGVGLSVVAFGAVAPEGRVERMIPEMWHDTAGERLVDLVAAIHDTGAAACLQLGHGGRQVSPRVTGQAPVGPSPVPPRVHVDQPPRALSTGEVEEVVAAFGHAAGQAAAAGFDAVELHGAHGYLVHQFLSAESNQRDDRYGGTTVAERARFGVEVIEAIRARGPDLAVLVRINGDDLVPGGQTRDDAASAAHAFSAAGAHAIVVSAGVYGSVPYTIPLLDDVEATFLDPCRHVKASVDIPVVAVGRISVPATAEAILARGDADAVALGRALLADPDWVAKATAGTPGSIRPCIATVQGCAGMLQHGDPISCSVNPDVGREHLLTAVRGSATTDDAPGTPNRRRRVTVIGGGVAGLEAARHAHALGHAVTLFERSDTLGGAAARAARTPPLAHLSKLVHWYERALGEIDLRLSIEATAADIAATQPDLVVVATGAIEAPPVVDGYEALPAWLASDALDGQPSSLGTTLPGRLAVIGGGQRGLAVALWSAANAIETLVVSDGRAGTDTSGLARRALLDRLRRLGVPIHMGRVTRLHADGVDVQTEAGTMVVACDGVIVADPLRPAPVDGLVPSDVARIRIGDAREPRTIAAAIAEARDSVDAFVRDPARAT